MAIPSKHLLIGPDILKQRKRKEGGRDYFIAYRINIEYALDISGDAVSWMTLGL